MKTVVTGWMSCAVWPKKSGVKKVTKERYATQDEAVAAANILLLEGLGGKPVLLPLNIWIEPIHAVKIKTWTAVGSNHQKQCLSEKDAKTYVRFCLGGWGEIVEGFEQAELAQPEDIPYQHHPKSKKKAKRRA